MGEILRESPTSVKPVIAVAVGSSKSSMYPLKWALENLVAPGSCLHLIHVYPPLRYIPTKVRGKALAELKQQQRIDLGPSMKIFESVCRQKKVKSIVSLVENDSIRKGLVDHISQLVISKLVIGHTPRNKLALAFSGPTKSNYVMKQAPYFCTVFTIYKDKLLSQHTNELLFQVSSGSLSDYRIGNDTSDKKPSPSNSSNNPGNSGSIGSGLSSGDAEQDSKDEIRQGSDVTLQQQLDAAMREIEKQLAHLVALQEAFISSAKMMSEKLSRTRWIPSHILPSLSINNDREHNPVNSWRKVNSSFQQNTP